MDGKILRKISNLYRNHNKKNSVKLKIELEGLVENQYNSFGGDTMINKRNLR